MIYSTVNDAAKPSAINVIASYKQLNRRRRTNVEDFIFDVTSSIINIINVVIEKTCHVYSQMSCLPSIKKVMHSRSQDTFADTKSTYFWLFYRLN